MFELWCYSDNRQKLFCIHTHIFLERIPHFCRTVIRKILLNNCLLMLKITLLYPFSLNIDLA